MVAFLVRQLFALFDCLSGCTVAVFALNIAAVAGCVGMRSPVAPHPRLSLNLSALLDSRRIVVLITGAKKWSTYCAASADGPAEQMPIRCVLRQRHTPVEVMWAP